MPAQLTTRPLAFNGSHLFLNLVLRPAGWLRVEVLPAHGDGDAPLCPNPNPKPIANPLP